MKNLFTGRLATIGDFLQTQHFAFGDLKNIFSWSYWTEADIPTSSPYLLLSLVTVIIAVAWLIYWRRRIKVTQEIAPVYEQIINQLANIIAFIIIIGISYIFFRSQAIAYLSSRLVILVALIVIIGWLSWIIYYQLRITPAKSRDYLERERFFRYIPKSKVKSANKK